MMNQKSFDRLRGHQQPKQITGLGIDDSSSVTDTRQGIQLSRRLFIGTAALLPLTINESSYAKSPEKSGALAQRVSTQIRVLTESGVLRNGDYKAVERALFSMPVVPLRSTLQDLDRKDLFARVALEYVPASEGSESGLLSFPVAPSNSRPGALYDSRRELPDSGALQGNPFMMLFDGSTVFWNTIRVGQNSRLSPSFWLHAARNFDPGLLSDIRSGQQVHRIDRDIPPPYNAAGIVPVSNETFANSAPRWVNLAWLKIPGSTESNGVLNPNKLYWEPQLEGAYMYDLATHDGLRSFIASQIGKQLVDTNPLHQIQKELLFAALPKASLVVLAADATPIFENTMQHASGGAVLDLDVDKKPVLAGQLLWKITLQQSGGNKRTAYIVSGPEMTRKALV